MKKTILAIAIPALFASAAHAVTVYDQDGTTFAVNGRVQAEFGQLGLQTADADGHRDAASTEVKAHTRLGVAGKTALNNTWSALAFAEWQVESERDGKYKTDEGDSFQARHVYAGFDGGQNGQVLFGQTDTAYYMGLIERTDIFDEFGNAAVGYDGRQEGQIIYRNTWNGAFLNASYLTNNDASSAKDRYGKSTDAPLERGYSASAGYDFDFGLGLAAGFERKDFKVGALNKADIDHKNDWALVASYTFDNYYFAALYNESRWADNNGEYNKLKGYELAASYKIDAWDLFAGYNKADMKNDRNAIADHYGRDTELTIVGVTYNFTTKLKAYGAYQFDGQDNDNQWVTALQYNF